MTWNVRVHRHGRSEWIGTVNAPDEQEARVIAILKFDIEPEVDFDVSERPR